MSKVFFAKNVKINYFWKKIVTGIWQGPKYASEDFFFKTRKNTTIWKF